MVHLVQLVLDDHWHVTEAAERLRERVKDEAVLRQMSARVQVAWYERPSEVAHRAVLTLSAAMRSLQPA